MQTTRKQKNHLWDINKIWTATLDKKKQKIQQFDLAATLHNMAEEQKQLDKLAGQNRNELQDALQEQLHLISCQ